MYVHVVMSGYGGGVYTYGSVVTLCVYGLGYTWVIASCQVRLRNRIEVTHGFVRNITVGETGCGGMLAELRQTTSCLGLE